MATLAEKLKMKLGPTVIRFVGVPEPSGVLSSEGEPYYICQLESPITVRCSTEPSIPPLETDVLYVRESAINSDQWKYVDEKKAEKGFWMDGWVADFSINQKIAIYQATSILAYVKTQRGLKNEKRLGEVRDSIAKQIEDFKAKQAAAKK